MNTKMLRCLETGALTVALAAAAAAQSVATPRSATDYKEYLSGPIWSNTSVPVNGTGPDWKSHFEEPITQVMRKHNLVGVGFCVYLNGKRTIDQGYGYSNLETRERFKSTTLCRIASISKYFLGRTIERLYASGKLQPTMKVATFLEGKGIKPKVSPGQSIDPRVYDVTVDHLLKHTSGIMGDGFFGGIGSPRLKRALGIPGVPTVDDYASWILGYPLVNKPGETYKYSNQGYNLLGFVVAKVLGEPLVGYIQKDFQRAYGLDTTLIRPASFSRLDAHIGETRYYLNGSFDKDYASFNNSPEEVAEGFLRASPVYGLDRPEWFQGATAWAASAQTLAYIAASVHRNNYSGASSGRGLYSGCASVLNAVPIKRNDGNGFNQITYGLVANTSASMDALNELDAAVLRVIDSLK